MAVDAVAVAGIAAVGSVLAGSIPAYIHAKKVASNVGQTNGHGTLAQMTEHILIKLGSIDERQERLESYIHKFKHDSANDLTEMRLTLDLHTRDGHGTSDRAAK